MHFLFFFGKEDLYLTDWLYNRMAIYRLYNNKELFSLQPKLDRKGIQPLFGFFFGIEEARVTFPEEDSEQSVIIERPVDADIPALFIKYSNRILGFHDLFVLLVVCRLQFNTNMNKQEPQRFVHVN
jgi:hypothetical protein